MALSVSLALCFGFALCFKLNWLARNVAEAVSLLFLAIAGVGFLIMAIRVFWTSFRDADQTVTAANRRAALHDATLIGELGDLSEDEVRFLAKRLRLNADHLQDRIALLVGPFSKFGVFPLAVGAGWAVLKAHELTPDEWTLIKTVLVGLSLIYLVALLLSMRRHRVEECAQALEFLSSRGHKPVIARKETDQ